MPVACAQCGAPTPAARAPGEEEPRSEPAGGPVRRRLGLRAGLALGTGGLHQPRDSEMNFSAATDLDFRGAAALGTTETAPRYAR